MADKATTQVKTPEKAKAKKHTTIHALGRRKTSVCTVNVLKGEGESLVNGKTIESYFTVASHKAAVLLPFVATKTLGHYYFTATSSGGGMRGQADSLKLALARALASESETMHVELSKAGLLMRDPRAKERKKVFFVRARKRPQYSKR